MKDTLKNNFILCTLKVLFTFFLFISCNTSTKNKEISYDISLFNEHDKLMYSGNYKAVIKLNNSYMEIADRMHYDEGKGLCYLKLADLNRSIGNYTKAFSLLQKAEFYIKKSKKKLHYAALYDAYSLLSFSLQLPDQGAKYSNKALAYLRRSEDSKFKNNILGWTYLNKSKLHYNQFNKDSSLIYLHKLKYFNRDLSMTFITLHYTNYDKDNDSLSIYAQELTKILNNKRTSIAMRTAINLTLGIYYYDLKQYQKAKEKFIEASENNKTAKNTMSFFSTSIYSNLSSTFKELQNREKEKFYQYESDKEYNKNEENRLRAINNISQKYTVDNLEWDRIKHKNNFILILTIGSIVSLIVLCIIFIKIMTLKKHKKNFKDEVSRLKMNNDEKNFKQIIELAKKNDLSFLTKFQELYPEFIDNLLNICPDIKNSEIIFCAMIKLNFSSKEIATYTFVQHASVQHRKRRLRKRLNIDSSIDLYSFFAKL
ncbi:hypothetical protein [Elizabethkingia anophelis]|uniref:hypothetical protein n=1 Tax=Elizabethkingia anophelis TaxID=1117645 RepID=UPI00389195AF